jgi:hypothetical protein
MVNAVEHFFEEFFNAGDVAHGNVRIHKLTLKLLFFYNSIYQIADTLSRWLL